MISEQLWAMEPVALEQFLETFEKAQEQALLLSKPGSMSAAVKLEVTDGVAKIQLRGAMMEDPPWFLRMFSRVAVPSEIIEQMEAAQARTDVTKIEIIVDSPGGMVAAGSAMAEYIASWKGKELLATCKKAASAAYWSVVACDQIEAAKTAEVGSIGVFAVVRDTSKAADDMGVKVHLVKSGAFKGVGTPGVPVSDDQLAMLQDRVNTLAGFFKDAVIEARGDVPAEAFDGQTFFGDQALALGLIDRVTTMEADMGNKNTQATAPAQEQEAATPAAVNTAVDTSRVEDLAAQNDALLAKNLEFEAKIAELEANQTQLKANALLAEARAKGIPERFITVDGEPTPFAELAKINETWFAWFAEALAEKAVIPQTETQGGGDDSPSVTENPKRALAKQLFEDDQKNGGVRFGGKYDLAVIAARDQLKGGEAC